MCTAPTSFNRITRKQPLEPDKIDLWIPHSNCTLTLAIHRIATLRAQRLAFTEKHVFTGRLLFLMALSRRRIEGDAAEPAVRQQHPRRVLVSVPPPGWQAPQLELSPPSARRSWI